MALSAHSKKLMSTSFSFFIIILQKLLVNLAAKLFQKEKKNPWRMIPHKIKIVMFFVRRFFSSSKWRIQKSKKKTHKNLQCKKGVRRKIPSRKVAPKKYLKFQAQKGVRRKIPSRNVAPKKTSNFKHKKGSKEKFLRER
jgi:hypothetical protein